MKIVEFPRVPLGDIPSRLRRLADQIENLEIENVETVICLIPVDGAEPRILIYGDYHPSDIVMTLATAQYSVVRSESLRNAE